jgi:hypothetical protein
VTYTGGANFANFVDNGTLAKTITVTTGDLYTGFTLSKLRVVIDFQAIDTENPASFDVTQASYPNEKSFTLTSPAGTTITLLAV